MLRSYRAPVTSGSAGRPGSVCDRSADGEVLAEHSPEGVEAFGDEAVPDPQPPLFPFDQARVHEDSHVMADGRL